MGDQADGRKEIGERAGRKFQTTNPKGDYESTDH
jgi:hypothetical protein